MKILLVDDDAFLRDMYATKFTERGDTVEVAKTAESALTLVQQGAFDVVVLDMVMPDMTGVDLIKSIHSVMPEQRCIVLSNQSESFDKEAAEKVGAIGYIVKADLIPSEVVEKVHSILEAAGM
jgi:DNA-binding NarL/FixJ family response regulator